jgi:hypothetical protein
MQPRYIYKAQWYLKEFPEKKTGVLSIDTFELFDSNKIIVPDDHVEWIEKTTEEYRKVQTYLRAKYLEGGGEF